MKYIVLYQAVTKGSLYQTCGNEDPKITSFTLKSQSRTAPRGWGHGRAALYPWVFPFKVLILRHLVLCLHFHAKPRGHLGCINPVMDVLEGFAHLIKRVWATAPLSGAAFLHLSWERRSLGLGFAGQSSTLFIYVFWVRPGRCSWCGGEMGVGDIRLLLLEEIQPNPALSKSLALPKFAS